MDLYEDNGYCVNENFYGLSSDAIINCYNSATWTYNCYNVTTDTAKNTWCRAPGNTLNPNLAKKRLSKK